MTALSDMIDQLEAQDFDYYLESMLDSVPEDVDTREGSIIYDALAPTANVLAEQALNMAEILRETYISTASGEYLDYRAEEHGTQRLKATYATVKATATDQTGGVCKTVAVGDQFSSIGAEPITYTVQSVEDDHSFIMVSDTAGTKANSYTGQILPITPNDALSYAKITAVTMPARDDEDDETLRSRLLQTTPWLAYGGNVADYQAMIADIVEVGAVQIYPTWNGAGTVKLVILGADMKVPSAELISDVTKRIDPAPGQGYGLAPIDHRVTVVAPTPVTVNIGATIEVDTAGGYTKQAVQSAIESAINQYFTQLVKSWGTPDSATGRSYKLTVMRSQILAKILGVAGVTNSSLPTLNGKEEDIAMVFNNQTSQLPVRGTVTLNG